MTEMVYGSMPARVGEPVIPRWWRTIDKWSLTCILMLFGIGLLLGLAASVPLATRNGLEPFPGEHVFNFRVAHHGECGACSGRRRRWSKSSGLRTEADGQNPGIGPVSIMPISSAAHVKRVHRPAPARDEGDILDVSRRLTDLAILAGQEANPKYRSPAKKAAVMHFRATAQSLVLRALQTCLNLRHRHARRRTLDRWLQAMDRKRILWQFGPGSKHLTVIMGRQWLLKERLFQAWKSHSRHAFAIWVKLHQNGARRKRKKLETHYFAWAFRTAQQARQEWTQSFLRNRSGYWGKTKALRAWHKWMAAKTGVLMRAENSCHMALLHVFAAWRNALTDLYRNRVRQLKGTLLLKAADMHSVSRAFALCGGRQRQCCMLHVACCTFTVACCTLHLAS